MEHSYAINQVLLPVCMGIIVCFFGCIWYMLRRILTRNDEDHDRFANCLNRHSIRLTRLETRLSHMTGRTET